MDIDEILLFEDEDGYSPLERAMPFIPSFDGVVRHTDVINDYETNKFLRYHCAGSVAEGIVNQLRDENPTFNIKEIKITPTKKTGVNGLPYVAVDFVWFSADKNIDPNFMETSHIQNAIKYTRKLIDEGNKTEMEGERTIRGFNKILDARSSESVNQETVSETYRQLKGMENPIISVMDKSTGEVIELDNIPYAVLLDLVKKYN